MVFMFVAASICGCEREEPDARADASPPASRPKSDSENSEQRLEAALLRFAAAHSALTLKSAGLLDVIDSHLGYTTLRVQDEIAKLNGKPVAIVAEVVDIYRSPAGLRVLLNEGSTKERCLLSLTDEHARLLSDECQASYYTTLLVIVKLTDVRVRYEPHHYAVGSDEYEPLILASEELGLDIDRLMLGELVTAQCAD